MTVIEDAIARCQGGNSFVLHGLAGTGKTTLLAALARHHPGAALCAPTGHAAAVLRERFEPPARTIHEVFYRLRTATAGTSCRRLEPRHRAGSCRGVIVLIDGGVTPGCSSTSCAGGSAAWCGGRCRRTARSTRRPKAHASGNRSWCSVTTRRAGLWNGDVEVLDDDVRPADQTVRPFRVSESGGSAGTVEFPLGSFEGMPEAGGAPGGLELAFGHCLTVHKAQGSEWRSVLLYDEVSGDAEACRRWRYTAITRASERIVIVNGRYNSER
jgi:hypothetical protein